MSPQRQPLRPAEIPLKLPVRLIFGMQNPQIQETQIHRLPYQQQEQQQEQPCDERGVYQKGYNTVDQPYDHGHGGHGHGAHAAVLPPEPPELGDG